MFLNVGGAVLGVAALTMSPTLLLPTREVRRMLMQYSRATKRDTMENYTIWNWVVPWYNSHRQSEICIEACLCIKYKAGEMQT